MSTTAPIPDEATVASLALFLLRAGEAVPGSPDHKANLDSAEEILRSYNLAMLLACAMAWWNGEGVKEHGAPEWARRLEAFLADAARLRAESGEDNP